MVNRFQPRVHWLPRNLANQPMLLGAALLLLSSPPNANERSALLVGPVLDHANSLYADKKFDDARQAFEQALVIDRGSLSAWRGLGWSYWALGQKPRAYQIWTDVLKGFPDDAQTLSALAKASEQDQRWQDADGYYTKLLFLQAHDPSAHLGKARILLAQHDFPVAELEARAVLADDPTNAQAKSLLADTLIGQHHYQSAELLLRTVAIVEPVPNNLNRLGKVQAELGKYPQAAENYKKSLKLKTDAGTLAAWRGLGASLRKAGQNAAAYRIWEGLLQSQPRDLPTLLAIGRASEQDQLWEQGLDAYGRVLQKSPNDHDAALGRARIFSAQQNYPAAELELTALLQHSPSDTQARTALAETLVAMGRGQEAAIILKPIAENNPSAKKLSRLGTILNDAGNDDEASAYFQQSLQLDPDDSTAVLGLAHSYWEKHDYTASIALLQGYLAKHPDNENVRTRLAEHASAADDWELAEREWRYLADKHPEQTKWQLKLAMLLHRNGQHDEAITIAKNVIAKEPNNEMAMGLLADDALFSGNLESAIYWTNRQNTLSPSIEKITRLGRMRVQLGERLDKENRHDAALIQYGAATQDFRRAAALDPIKSGAPIDIVQTLRLQDQPEESIAYAKQLQAQYPASIDVNKQLAVTYQEQEAYSEAQATLTKNTAFLPNSSALQQNLADLTYHAGDKEAGFALLNDALETTQRPTIPILLYHGITVSDHRDTVSLQKFREQLLALKKEGYQSITMSQLQGAMDGTGSLPSKPLLITFDDARADSFKYADPVLEETGFRATMFVPVEDVATHQPYAAVWTIVRKMLATQRWDMQCHGSDAQHYIPVDAEGHLGHFLANKMWLKDTNRLETDPEFAARIEQDMLTCKQTIARELPGTNVIAFAFPYGDQGHRSLSNTPEAFSINQATVKKQFSLAFNVDNTYLATSGTPRYILPRFEVPRSYSGADLVQQLKTIDPVTSTSYKLAHLDVESGRYGQALNIINTLDKEGAVDKAELLTTSGKILNWSGDHAGARTSLNSASTLRPNDPLIQKEIANLDSRLGASVQMSGLYFEDNADRRFYSLGPSLQYGVSDRLSVAAYYKYLDFKQTLDPARDGVITEQQFETTGNQFGGQFNYELAARSHLSLSAGVADFSENTASPPAKSGITFPLGAVELTSGLGDKLDVSIAADHTYVNTAAAILDDLAFTRVKGGATYKINDPLSVGFNHAYFDYTDNNQRNRTEVSLDSKVLNNPDVSVGAQFIHDDTQTNSPLFWTPNSYMAFSIPVNLQKKWGKDFVTELALAPGMGKEASNNFDFQFNGAGIVKWNVKDNLSLSLSLNRYQAATYSNFSAFFGMFIKF
ncbi:hypothetical protein JCM14076_23570 [Methylosoma difficile]